MSTVTHPFCGPGSGVLLHLRGHLFTNVLILAVLSSKSIILTRFTSKTYYTDFIKPEYEEEVRMLATVYLDGKKLKRIRTLKGKTQRALSSESGVSTSTIWLLEKREKNENFHPPTLTKLARALGVEPTDLVSGE
jgi:DNA-binding Xre family transcriptional regulator